MEDDKNIQNIRIGSAIGLSFDMGKFDHPIYGTANLSGNIPLILPYGTYVEPAIIKDQKRLETMITKLIPECRDLWENDLDKEIAAKLKDGILGVSCLNPMDDIATPGMQAFLILVCLTFAGDDVVDNFNEYSKELYQYKSIRKIYKNMEASFDINDGVLKIEQEISSPIPALQYLIPFIRKVLNPCVSSIPDIFKNGLTFKQECLNYVLGFALIKKYTKGNEQFSHSSKQLFAAYQAGMLPGLEFTTLIRGVKLSDEIRNDILFQRMRIEFGIASNLMNDILGCGRDIRLNQTTDSSILFQVVQKGASLQNTFDKVLAELSDAINDVKIAGKILRECYSDDENLLEYVNCTERMLDGQLYGYKHIRRYGELNLKVVSTEQ